MLILGIKGLTPIRTLQNMSSSVTLHFRFWLCTFTLTVSLGAVLLLPMSIFSNEIMIMYPNSYYIKWLNGSLIHGTLYCIQLFQLFQ